MVMNILIVTVWVIAIGLFGIGFLVKDLMEEKRRKKANERLWS